MSIQQIQKKLPAFLYKYLNHKTIFVNEIIQSDSRGSEQRALKYFYKNFTINDPILNEHEYKAFNEFFHDALGNNETVLIKSDSLTSINLSLDEAIDGATISLSPLKLYDQEFELDLQIDAKTEYLKIIGKTKEGQSLILKNDFSFDAETNKLTIEKNNHITSDDIVSAKIYYEYYISTKIENNSLEAEKLLLGHFWKLSSVQLKEVKLNPK